MHDGRHHALAAEPIQRPEHDQIEPTPAGVLKELGELLTLVGALSTALVIDIFGNQIVASVPAPVAQLHELVLRILIFVVRAYPSIDCNAHGPPHMGKMGPLFQYELEKLKL